MNIFYSGIFGRRAADIAALRCNDACLIDMNQTDAAIIAKQCKGGKALVLLSDASGAGLDALATGFREAGVVWTAVNLYPAMLRIGPLIKADGVCFECATRRYLSAPGSDGLMRLEELLRGAAAKQAITFPVVPATVVEMAVSEAMRQINDVELPAGFILKVDFVDISMTSAVARPLHGCTCCNLTNRNRTPGERFYADLESDMLELTGGIA
ncbi:TOMM precursor leader peptide-binding protein [Massilia sp. W12]|uniref:TOMM precursor leader peptide-binding protein n=1 Tax=Massilia sp. W12 TaxID=3126507 RepID=UPI0030D3D86D